MIPEYSAGIMLQRYIRTPADPSVMLSYTGHRHFVAPLLCSNNPSDDVKKCQQAFLASLPGMTFVKIFY